MGNNDSKKRNQGISAQLFGNVFLKTDKFCYFSGDIVIGNIYLNVIKEGFPGCIVYLSVSGKEKSQWTETETSTSTDSDGNTSESTSTYTYNGKSILFKNVLQVHHFECSSLPIGQFIFPFSFQLLSHLPGSFNLTDLSYIRYKVKAIVKSTNQSYNSMQYCQMMTIRETLKQNQKPLSQEISIEAQDCCFTNEGTCHFKCIIDKNHYLSGDEVQLEFDIDNSNSSRQVNSILILLSNSLTFTDNNGRQKQYFGAIAQQEFEGVDPRGKKKSKAKFNLINQVSKEELRPSTNGNLVNSVYSLSVKVNVDSDCCCNEAPSINFPIQILASIPQNNDIDLKEPPNWNPQVFQIQKFYSVDRSKQQKDRKNNQVQNMQQPMQE